MNILALVFFVALLSVAGNILGAGVVRRLRNALEHTTQQSNEARGQVVLLQGEVRLLDEALARRDQTVAEVTRELQALRIVLGRDGAPEPCPASGRGFPAFITAAAAAAAAEQAKERLRALAALERLARDGYGPTFTQRAVHAGGELHTFGPEPEEFAAAILRVAAGAGGHVRERIAATDATRPFVR